MNVTTSSTKNMPHKTICKFSQMHHTVPRPCNQHGIQSHNFGYQNMLSFFKHHEYLHLPLTCPTCQSTNFLSCITPSQDLATNTAYKVTISSFRIAIVIKLKPQAWVGVGASCAGSTSHWTCCRYTLKRTAVGYILSTHPFTVSTNNFVSRFNLQS
jgi:hypothetical protein